MKIKSKIERLIERRKKLLKMAKMLEEKIEELRKEKR